MDEGVATLLYKVIHIDDNLVVLNLDGTDNFCFLINDASQSLANASFEDIQWYLYRRCSVDMLSEEQKRTLKITDDSISVSFDPIVDVDKGDEDILYFIAIAIAIIVVVIIYCVAMNN